MVLTLLAGLDLGVETVSRSRIAPPLHSEDRRQLNSCATPAILLNVLRGQ